MAIPENLINKIMLYREPTEMTKAIKRQIKTYQFALENYYADEPNYSLSDYYFGFFHAVHVFCPKCKKYAGHPHGHDFDTPNQQALCKTCLYSMLGSEEILQMTAELLEPVWYADNVSESESEN